MAKKASRSGKGAARRSGEDLDFPGDAEGAPALHGYLALPPLGHGRGVLVVQEWWGLVDHIRDVCDRLAREGFVALAPDLYHGERASDPDAAGRLMLDLEIPRAERDLAAAAQALLGHQSVTGPRLGAIGFCMGGQLALFAATRNPRIGAVVDFYGIHPRVTLDFSQLQAAVLGLFAERDSFVPPEAARKLESDLRSAGKRVRIRIFSGANHAFFNDTRPDVYDAAAAASAWADTLAFLRQELG
ncbi:MAG TPA: dienelactone hydrolase family protein [Myxococcota bacterium]|nr:dienelactone hydrolase family protein [Myxococcota bacterium]